MHSSLCSAVFIPGFFATIGKQRIYNETVKILVLSFRSNPSPTASKTRKHFWYTGTIFSQSSRSHEFAK